MTQQIFAVVGGDRCGKTEISHALAKVLALPYFKAESEHDTYLNHKERFIEQLRYADTRILDFLKQTSHSVVMDRAWPCEYAYASVFNRQTDVNVLTKVDEGMASLGARVIICHRSSYKGIVDDIDPQINQPVLERLDAAYVNFSQWTKCKTLLLNVDDENLEREVSDILKWIEWTTK